MKSHLSFCACVTTAMFSFAVHTQYAHAQDSYPHYELGGHVVHHVDRSWDGIGAESGPITRARIVRKHVHATPDFVIEGSPYTTTPIDLPYGTDSPNRFGVSGDTLVRIFVKVGQTWLTVDPFRQLEDRAPVRLRRAQNAWLNEHGYVNHARIVRRVDRGHVADAAEGKETSLPQPRAILRIREEEKPAELELQVRNSSGSKILIVDENWERNVGEKVQRLASSASD